MGNNNIRQSSNIKGGIFPQNIPALSALAEPSRRRIVELLYNGPLTVGEISTQLSMRQPQTSKHLKVLSDSGILEIKAEANRRIYQLRPDPFQALDAWLDPFRQIMYERFDNLDSYLQKLEAKKKS